MDLAAEMFPCTFTVRSDRRQIVDFDVDRVISVSLRMIFSYAETLLKYSCEENVLSFAN